MEQRPLPEFKASIDDVKARELLNILEDVNPQTLTADLCNGLIEDCNDIIKSAAVESDMFVNRNSFTDKLRNLRTSDPMLKRGCDKQTGADTVSKVLSMYSMTIQES